MEIKMKDSFINTIKNVVLYSIDKDGKYHSLNSYFNSVKRKRKIIRLFNEENVPK